MVYAVSGCTLSIFLDVFVLHYLHGPFTTEK